jgi:hypothetical protein
LPPAALPPPAPAAAPRSRPRSSPTCVCVCVPCVSRGGGGGGGGGLWAHASLACTSDARYGTNRGVMSKPHTTVGRATVGLRPTAPRPAVRCDKLPRSPVRPPTAHALAPRLLTAPPAAPA